MLAAGRDNIRPSALPELAMRTFSAQSAFSVVSIAVMATSAIAAGALSPAPPVKPGLWEVTNIMMDRNGEQSAAMQKMAQAMKDMPPEMRERMDAMMKSRGVGMGGANGAVKTCMTKETFEQDQWQGARSGCTTNYSARTGNTWKWHSSCPKLKSESDGEAVFTNTENYTAKVVTHSTATGKDVTSNVSMTAKWLGANCGDIKPMTAKSMEGH